MKIRPNLSLTDDDNPFEVLIKSEQESGRLYRMGDSILATQWGERKCFHFDSKRLTIAVVVNSTKDSPE